MTQLSQKDFNNGIDYAAHHVMMFACSELNIPMTLRGEHLVDRAAEAATLRIQIDKFCINAVKKWLLDNKVSELNYQFAYLNAYHQEVATAGILMHPEKFIIEQLEPGRIISFASTAPIMTVRCSYNVRDKAV